MQRREMDKILGSVTLVLLPLKYEIDDSVSVTVGAGKNGPGKKGPGKKGPVKRVQVKTVLGKNGPGKKGPSDYLDSI